MKIIARITDKGNKSVWGYIGMISFWLIVWPLLFGINGNRVAFAGDKRDSRGYRIISPSERQAIIEHVKKRDREMVGPSYSPTDDGFEHHETEVQEADEEDRVGLYFTVSAAEHKENRQSRYFFADAYGQINFSGLVKDDAGQPIAGARVVLETPAAWVVTDGKGAFNLSIPMEGEPDNVFNSMVHFTLERIIKGLNATIEIVNAPLIANGREQMVILTVTDDNGNPIAGRDLFLSLPEDWVGPNNRKVDYMAFPPGFQQSVRTDKQGRVLIPFVAPAILTAHRGPLTGARRMDRLLFPVKGILKVVDRDSQKMCEVAYTLESPFPDIQTFQMTEADAGIWLKDGASLTVSDRDSDQFDVEIAVYGKLKVAEGGIYRNRMTVSLQGHTLVFYYQPHEIGDDLTAQPKDLIREFTEHNLKLVSKYMIDIGGGMLLNSVGGNTSDLSDIYDSAKTSWGKIETEDKIDSLKEDIDHRPNPKMSREASADHTMEITDVVIGCVEGMPDIADLSVGGGKSFGDSIGLGTATYNVPLEVSKVVLENCKLMLKFHRQFEAINDAYQNTVLMPIEITIRDADGHSVRSMSSVSVRAWKK